MSVEFRLLGPGDAGVLDRVAEEVFDEPIDPDRACAHLAEPGHLLLVAMEDGLVVGQCAAVIHRHPDKASELYVDEVGVSPAWQRRGLAREMMRRILEIGRERGCEEAWVGTECDNVPANALYQGFGSAPEPFNLYVLDLGEPGHGP